MDGGIPNHSDQKVKVQCVESKRDLVARFLAAMEDTEGEPLVRRVPFPEVIVGGDTTGYEQPGCNPRSVTFTEYLDPSPSELALAVARTDSLVRLHPEVLQGRLYVPGTAALISGVPSDPSWTRPLGGGPPTEESYES
eukprot:gene14507-biopygen4042